MNKMQIGHIVKTSNSVEVFTEEKTYIFGKSTVWESTGKAIFTDELQELIAIINEMALGDETRTFLNHWSVGRLPEFRINAFNPKSEDEKIAEAVEAFRKRQKPLENEGFAADVEDMQNEKGLRLLMFSGVWKGLVGPWQLLENPKKSRAIYSANEMLSDSQVKFVEFEIQDVRFRLIRYKDRAQYFPDSLHIPQSAKLNFNKPFWKKRKP